MTKLHTKKQNLTSRRAVAPVIATLLLVAIAVVGGSIIFVFSQGFFSSAQISGAPQVESLEVLGYDGTDVLTLILHDGECTAAAGCGTAVATDGLVDNDLPAGERVAVYIQNQSAQSVTLEEVSLAGNIYTYNNAAATLPVYGSNPANFWIVTAGDDTPGAAFTKTEQNPVLAAGEEVSIVFELAQGISPGRDTQFKVETANGNIFVGTMIAGQQSG